MTPTVPSTLGPILETEPRTQPPIQSTRLIAIALAAFLLIVYTSFPTRNHYWDGIAFALNIEEVAQDAAAHRIYFNPNHLLHNQIAHLIYRPLHAIWPRMRALDVLRGISMLASIGTAVLVFVMLRRSTGQLYRSIWLTLLMAFSATWWKFSTDSNAYVPSVFLLVLCAFLVHDPRRKPRPVMIGTVHALSILLHQISLLFFPAALLSIWLHPSWSGVREKRKSALAFAGTAGVIVLVAYFWVWLGVFGRVWSLPEFMVWVTSNGREEFAFRSIQSNALETLRSSVRLFFGGRISLALRFVEAPLLIVLVCLLLMALVWLVLSLRKTSGAVSPIGREREVASAFPDSRISYIAWAGAFAAFLFIWLTEYPYYRLYYLPALVLLAGFWFGASHRPLMGRRTKALPAFVCFMALFNFTFLVYPYSKTEATPPIHLALAANGVWSERALILYKDFTCDNWMMRYFNPHTDWRQVALQDRGKFEEEVRVALKQGRSVWLDTSLLGELESSSELREWMPDVGRLAVPWGLSNRKHHIQFAQILVDRVAAGPGQVRDEHGEFNW